MSLVLYDGSLEGFLTAVFEIYEYKILAPSICRADVANRPLFGSMHQVQTNRDKCTRVYKKLTDALSKTAVTQVCNSFLSETNNIENVLLRYIQYVLSSKQTIENDYSNADVLTVHQVSRKVHREKHRMEAFVRFQLTRDQLYYCLIQPDYNVLPLISKHFQQRYADQRWLIYDNRRKYGIYYDLLKVEEVEMNFDVDLSDRESIAVLNDEQEDLYQRLWQQYFSSINIPARKNIKLHIQHMPKRYWRWLTEKKP